MSTLTRLGCLIIIIITAVVLQSSASIAQSVPEQHSRVWPAAVRNVAHVEAVPATTQPAGYLSAGPINSLRTPLHPHRVLRSPKRQPAAGHHKSKLIPHPPHHAIHRRVQPAPAMLPEANQREIWKTPYSYGHFGASGTRHWTLHHGYRDRYTEWRLK